MCVHVRCEYDRRDKEYVSDIARAMTAYPVRPETMSEWHMRRKVHVTRLKQSYAG